jgi:chemotaxis signal transduction protein
MSTVIIARCEEFLVAIPTPMVRQVVAGPVLGRADPRCLGWRGMLAWRGTQIPLLDLRERLGAAAEEPPRRAVVTSFEDTTVALAVDDVLGIEEADLAAARAPLAGLAPVTSTADSFLMVIDYARLFTPAERAALASAALSEGAA